MRATKGRPGRLSVEKDSDETVADLAMPFGVAVLLSFFNGLDVSSHVNIACVNTVNAE